jgi:hypothetical protein
LLQVKSAGDDNTVAAAAASTVFDALPVLLVVLRCRGWWLLLLLSVRQSVFCKATCTCKRGTTRHHQDVTQQAKASTSSAVTRFSMLAY